MAARCLSQPAARTASSLCPASSPKKKAEAAPPAPVRHGQLFPLLAMRPWSHHPRHLCHHPLSCQQGSGSPRGGSNLSAPSRSTPGPGPATCCPGKGVIPLFEPPQPPSPSRRRPVSPHAARALPQHLPGLPPTSRPCELCLSPLCALGLNASRDSLLPPPPQSITWMCVLLPSDFSSTTTIPPSSPRAPRQPPQPSRRARAPQRLQRSARPPRGPAPAPWPARAGRISVLGHEGLASAGPSCARLLSFPPPHPVGF